MGPVPSGEGGVTFAQAYNAENRLATVKKIADGTCESPTRLSDQWDFTYDGDGNRAEQTYTPFDQNGDPLTAVVTAYFMGGLYEETGGVAKKYYAIAGMTVAMKDGAGIKYLLADHLGLVVAVTNGGGSLLSQQRYLPFGQVRTDDFAPGSITQTDVAYTGQRNLPALGLMDDKARFYDPGLGRFIQPDTIIPSLADPQSWNRYSYVLNDPLGYTDPSGHAGCAGNNWDDGPQCFDKEGRPKNLRIPGWDAAFRKNVSEKDRRAAIRAYLNFLSAPNQFAEYYVNPRNARWDYSALELFTEYSTLHTTADQLIWNKIASQYGMQAAEALSNARLHNLEALQGSRGNGTTGILTAIGVISAAVSGSKGGGYVDAWYRATFPSAEASAQYHYAQHGGPWSSIEDYTQAGQDFYARNVDLAKPWRLGTGEIGVKITTNDYFGIYTIDGQIVTFGER